MPTLSEFQRYSYLFGANAPYVEDLYESYLHDPSSVASYWAEFFAVLVQSPAPDGSMRSDVCVSEEVARFLTRPVASGGAVSSEVFTRQLAVSRWVDTFRWFGSRWADLDPLKRFEPMNQPALHPSYWDLDVEDTYAYWVSFAGEILSLTIAAIEQRLKAVYCGTLSVDCAHLEMEERAWWYNRIDRPEARVVSQSEEKQYILNKVMAAETFEFDLSKRFAGAKRFGGEGLESSVMCMDRLLCLAAASDYQHVIFGLAHRARLNVMVNVIGKSPRDLFDGFQAEAPYREDFSGDVKYHMGIACRVQTPSGEIHASMEYNPSHLEIVSAVEMGAARARMDRHGDTSGHSVLPVVTHGDAAFTGQGVVQEILNMSLTRGYSVGGSIHIIMNNQVGFTTSYQHDARSTFFPSDMVKGYGIPVIHVNADDPEAVYVAAQWAFDYRHHFHKDVVLNIVGYRRNGHNEMDDPFVTQPYTYQLVAKRQRIGELYAARLAAEGLVPQDCHAAYVKAYRAALDQGEVLGKEAKKISVEESHWHAYLSHPYTDEVETAVTSAQVAPLARCLTTVPEGMVLRKTVQKVLHDRQEMYAGAKHLDWGAAENMAYASLLAEGISIRLTGEDVGRGTFAHRHAVLYDQNTPEWEQDKARYIPLSHVNSDAVFDIYDSVLSEEGVLAFEYGYASHMPQRLVIWEAQFGDFCNGAQVVFDQFIASSETKWGIHTGLVCLLPHGMEGQGPEHSSARLERHLELCADHNWVVCVPSHAGQIFHLLRRQMHLPFRKPLIVLTPKSLLRKEEACVPLDILLTGRFETVIADETVSAQQVTRLIVCSGKVYYDLAAHRQASGRQDTAIVRIEQLYPFPEVRVRAVIESYPGLQTCVWCQEEPENMGAWRYICHHLFPLAPAGRTWRVVARRANASPAVGFGHWHAHEQAVLVDTAFA